MTERSGTELVAHTQRMFAFWHRGRDGTLSRDVFACHMLFLQSRIEEVLRRGSSCGEPRLPHTCRHILKLRESLWTFIHMPGGIEPTNNLAECTCAPMSFSRKSASSPSLAASHFTWNA